MAARTARRFSDVYESGASHENATNLRELIDKEFTIQDVDFGRSQYGKVSYLQIGDSKDTGLWHYTTSQVVLAQLQEVMAKKPFPLIATLREKKDYLCLE